MAEELGDAHEHVGVDAGTFEHLINVAALAVDGTREPGHRAALRLQLRLYHPAYVYGGHIDVFPSEQKNRELLVIRT